MYQFRNWCTWNLWATDVQCTRNMTSMFSSVCHLQARFQYTVWIFSVLWTGNSILKSRWSVVCQSFVFRDFFLYKKKVQLWSVMFWLLAGNLCCFKHFWFCLFKGWCFIVSTMFDHINYAIYFHLTYAPTPSALSALWLINTIITLSKTVSTTI